VLAFTLLSSFAFYSHWTRWWVGWLKELIMHFYLYEALIGLSKTSYETEKQARWNAIQQKELNPELGFVTVVAIDKQLSDKERAAWKPEIVSAW